MTLVVRTVPVEEPNGLLGLLTDRSGMAWVRRGEGFVGFGEAVRIDAGTGPERFSRAAERLAEAAGNADVHDEVGLPGSGLVAFGSFSFDPRTPGSVLVVPETVLGRRGGTTWLTVCGEPAEQPDPPPPPPLRPPDRVRYAGSSIPDHLWLDAVAQALKRISAGDVDKVVLARDYAVWDREPFDVRVLARRLASRFPACFTFVCDGLVGAPPELLVRRIGAEVESAALAGSAPRGGDEKEDAALGEALSRSDKDRLEHALTVASVRDVLAPVCEDIDVEEAPHLLRLDNVQHLETRVRGRLADPRLTALDLAAALHPTAAVGGVPRERALAMVRELEQMDRGRYAGPVGWVDARGDGEWGIALRCADIEGARARLFAGAGIVEGSLPEAELEETRLKLGAMQSAFSSDPPQPQ
jgi:menaquinone-specific isochorismate synthase